MKKLSLSQILFYLFILEFDDQPISKMNLNAIQIKLYDSIINGLAREEIISSLKAQLKSILATSYRDDFTFGLTIQEFPDINPKYHGKNITYQLSRNENEISLFCVNY